MIEDLKKIKHFIICPGARNQSFLKNSSLMNRSSFHFDERAAAFQVLGMSKMQNEPCAIVTTSGTAVGETLPAIMEAYHSNVKLVVISYDRPKRLKDVYAPQTTHQEDCLTSFIRSTSMEDDLYPKQINIISDLEHKTIRYKKSSSSKPLIIINSGTQVSLTSFFKMKERECYIHQEVLSPFYSYRDEYEVHTDEELNYIFNQGGFSSIIRLGEAPNSGLWRKLEKTESPPEVFHLIGKEVQSLSFGEIVHENHLDFIIQHTSKIKTKEYIDHPYKKTMELFPDSELFRLKYVIEKHDKKNTTFYFGNSMTIRNAKYFDIRNAKIQASRGLNGIDGQVSTSIGMAKSTGDDVVCIIGDQTFMIDSNSMFEDLPSNFYLYIINNKGGAIFERYQFDKKMANNHEVVISDRLKLPKNVFEIQVSKDQNKKLWKELDNQNAEEMIRE